MAKAKVAVLKCTPETILTDIARLCDLAGHEGGPGGRQDHHPEGQHLVALPVPGANTTPWQMEGTIQALRAAGFATSPACRTRPWSPTPSRARI